MANEFIQKKENDFQVLSNISKKSWELCARSPNPMMIAGFWSIRGMKTPLKQLGSIAVQEARTGCRTLG